MVSTGALSLYSAQKADVEGYGAAAAVFRLTAGGETGHARAQNMGQKAAEMLRLLPDPDVEVVERCSGHGGSWGFKQQHFETALKVGRPAARQMPDAGKAFITPECPLAGIHLAQGSEKVGDNGVKPQLVTHPIQLIAQAYGLA